MRTLSKVLAIATALLVAAPALEAQRPVRPLNTARPMRPLVRRALVRRALVRRAIMRRALADTAWRQAMKQRLQSLTPAQKQAFRDRMEAARTQREQLRQAVQSGQLTRAQARARMLEWRKAHRPERPGGARGPIRP